jgi:hypothetical protein
MLAGFLCFTGRTLENVAEGAGKKPHPSQTAVDSFFNYLYYSTQTTESEMFASAVAFPPNGHKKRESKAFLGSDSRHSSFSY